MVSLYARRTWKLFDESWVVSAEFTYERKKKKVMSIALPTCFMLQWKPSLNFCSFLFLLSLSNKVLDRMTPFKYASVVHVFYGIIHIQYI